MLRQGEASKAYDGLQRIRGISQKIGGLFLRDIAYVFERSKELRQTLLNKEYLSKVSDAEWAKKIFEYSRTLEGPVYIPLGEPRISDEKDKVKENLLYFIDSPDDPFKKAAVVLLRSCPVASKTEYRGSFFS